jgi:hypothetical protein
MPFWLKSAPFSFQAAMDKVLVGLQPQIAHVYLDDIVGHSQTFNQHLADLRRIFDRIRETRKMFLWPVENKISWAYRFN